MSGAITRRAVAALVASAAATMPTLATGAASASVPAGATDPIDALWRQRNTVVARSHELAVELEAATASMPAWARPGPAYIDSEGRAVSEGSRVPAIVDAKLPGPGGQRRVRVDRHSIDESYRIERRIDPAQALEVRRSRLAALEARLRAQAAEEERAGVTRIDEQIEQNCAALYAAEDAIGRVTATMNAVAAMLLIEVSYGDDRAATLEFPDESLSAALRILRFIRGELTGQIAADVAALLDAPAETTLSSMTFCAA